MLSIWKLAKQLVGWCNRWVGPPEGRFGVFVTGWTFRKSYYQCMGNKYVNRRKQYKLSNSREGFCMIWMIIVSCKGKTGLLLSNWKCWTVKGFSFLLESSIYALNLTVVHRGDIFWLMHSVCSRKCGSYFYFLSD